MPATMTPSQRDFILALLACAVALLTVHALGRFVFTPLLPHFINDGMLTLPQGAQLATWNYIGYLVGALLALRWYRPDSLRRALVIALIANALLTAAQLLTADFFSLLVLRVLNGATNGIVFVQAPALVLEWLARYRRPQLSGLVYLGVSIGLVLSSGLAEWPAAWLEGPARWWPAALLALPLALWSSMHLRKLDIPPAPVLPQKQAHAGPLFDKASTPLFLAYAGAGLGYILPMTFLPVLAVEQLPPGDRLIKTVWLWASLASLPTLWLWNSLGARWGDKQALALNYAVQVIGLAGPLFWPGAVGIWLCALLVGSTAIGTVLLTQRLARMLQPHQGPRLAAALIALYGFAQLLGPWLAELWLRQGGTLTGTWWIGLLALAWGLACSLAVPDPRKHELATSDTSP